MSNSSVPLLSAHSITKSFGPRAARHQVLFDVSVDVHAGECLAVIGGSGSGKSTLTRIMLGLEPADAGSVMRVDRKSTRLNSSHRTRHSFPTRRSSDLNPPCERGG